MPLYRTPFTEAPVDWHGPPPPTIVAAVQQDPVAAAAAPLLAKGAKALHIPLLFQPAPLLTALGSTSSLASRLITSTLSCVPLAALVQVSASTHHPLHVARGTRACRCTCCPPPPSSRRMRC